MKHTRWALLLLMACGCASPSWSQLPIDAGTDAPALDAPTVEVAPVDVRLADVRPTDVTAADVPPVDIPSPNDAAADVSPVDVTSPDAGPVDVTPVDVPLPLDAPTDVAPLDAPTDVALLDVAPTRCTTTRMCPGQVCSTRLGYCVDCDADLDCSGGQVCRANVCVPPPPPCHSSRECSAMGQVCDTTRSLCVDCLIDIDCPAEHFCAATSTCAPRICHPNATECVNVTRVRTCDPRGATQREADCTAGQTCRGGSCQAVLCTPGQQSCDPATGQRRRCIDDGSAWAPAPCAATESCRDGNCLARVCTPGAATCASMTARSVCNADGLSTTATPCASNEGCRDGGCVVRACIPASSTCASANVRSVCNADGFGTTPSPCPSTQRCAGGSCVDLVCVPGSSACVDSHTVRTCNADGSALVTVTCPAASTCVGTTCSSWVCTPGTTTCPAGATARTICNADGLATHSEACPTPANAAPQCGSDNACAFACATGFGDCDHVAADGCETHNLTDPSNCGGCGLACPARTHSASGCAGGTCVYACASGFADCDGNATNGCESDLTSTTSCGRCGVSCLFGQTCRAGVCTVTPLPNYTRVAPPSSVSFLDVCSLPGHRTVLTSTDDGALSVSMPFDFRYWGAAVPMSSEVAVSTNGFVYFGHTSGVEPLNGSIPSGNLPNNVVAPEWRDLVTGTEGVCLATVGAAPNRSFVVQWSNARNYPMGGVLDFEAVFNETDLTIDLLYAAMTGAMPATVGLENAAGSSAIGGCPGATTITSCVITDNTRWRFVPSP